MTRTASGQLPSSRTLSRTSAKGRKADIRSTRLNVASAAQADIPRFAKKGNYKNIPGRRKAA